MAELTPKQVVDVLRKCSSTLVCDGCPYGSLGTPTCMQRMQQDAAAMIEGLDQLNTEQAATIAKLRKILENRKPK